MTEEKFMYLYCVNDILELINRDSRTFSRKSREMFEHSEKQGLSKSLINNFLSQSD